MAAMTLLHTCIVVEGCQRDMVHPLIGSVEEGHEFYSVVHEAVDLPFLQNRKGDALLKALEHALQTRHSGPERVQMGMQTIFSHAQIPAVHKSCIAGGAARQFAKQAQRP